MSQNLAPPPFSAAEIEAMTVRPAPERSLEPLGDCIVFRAEDAPRTSGGLHIPGKGKGAEARKRAIVVAVGPKVTTVKPGDWIVLWPSETEVGAVDHTGETLWMCHEEDVSSRVVSSAEQPS